MRKRLPVQDLKRLWPNCAVRLLEHSGSLQRSAKPISKGSKREIVQLSLSIAQRKILHREAQIDPLPADRRCTRRIGNVSMTALRPVSASTRKKSDFGVITSARRMTSIRRQNSLAIHRSGPGTAPLRPISAVHTSAWRHNLKRSSRDSWICWSSVRECKSNDACWPSGPPITFRRLDQFSTFRWVGRVPLRLSITSLNPRAHSAPLAKAAPFSRLTAAPWSAKL